MAIDPREHLTLLAPNFPWRAMLIDYHEELALLYTSEKGWDEPDGVFPMWSAKMPTFKLREMLDRYPQAG